MVMNARSAVPDPAWEFMQWATSPQFLTRAALQGNMNPTRRSTWADPEFIARARQWHEFPEVAMELVSDLGEVLVTRRLTTSPWPGGGPGRCAMPTRAKDPSSSASRAVPRSDIDRLVVLTRLRSAVQVTRDLAREDPTRSGGQRVVAWAP